MADFDETILDEEETPDHFSMPTDVAMAWQFHEEIEYQSRLAVSFPVDADVIFAQNWLTEQRAW